MSLCSCSELTDHCPVPAPALLPSSSASSSPVSYKQGLSFKIRQQLLHKELSSFLLKVSPIQQHIMENKSNSKMLLIQEPHLECTQAERSHL